MEPGDDLIRRLTAEVDPRRLERRTLALVSIASPSGHEAAAADLYATQLNEAGLAVQIDRQFAESPSVIGTVGHGAARTPSHDAARRDAGRRDAGRTLQLDGHLDTVSTPHSPPYSTGETIVGRGACDMKGGLAAIAEVAQILCDHAVPLNGRLLVTAHGQHEEPAAGRSLHAPLIGLLNRGFTGDACLIPEGPHRELPIAGRGLIIFQATFWRAGDPVHEILSGDDPPANPIRAIHEFMSLFDRQRAHWGRPDPLAGPDSYFIGAVSGGDYYNRIPATASVRGTRRYPPGRTFAAVARELKDLTDTAAAAVGCQVTLDIEKSGQPFAVARDEPLLSALQASHQMITGHDLPLAGMKYSADGSQFVNEGGIPALYHGTDSTTAHSDHESVAVADLVRCAQVMLGTVLRYLGVEPHA